MRRAGLAPARRVDSPRLARVASRCSARLYLEDVPHCLCVGDVARVAAVVPPLLPVRRQRRRRPLRRRLRPLLLSETWRARSAPMPHAARRALGGTACMQARAPCEDGDGGAERREQPRSRKPNPARPARHNGDRHRGNKMWEGHAGVAGACMPFPN